MWRPDNWDKATEKQCAVSITSDKPTPTILFRDFFEAGADVMHRADIKWLEERIVITSNLVCFRILKEDWQAFKEE